MRQAWASARAASILLGAFSGRTHRGAAADDDAEQAEREERELRSFGDRHAALGERGGRRDEEGETDDETGEHGPVMTSSPAHAIGQRLMSRAGTVRRERVNRRP